MISSPPLTDTELLFELLAATGFEQELEPKLLVDLFFFYIL
jgi:hypothetical protein